MSEFVFGILVGGGGVVALVMVYGGGKMVFQKIIDKIKSDIEGKLK